MTSSKRTENSHSRQSSVASSHSTESGGKLSLGAAPNSVTSSEELGDCHLGIVVALHRKMVRYPKAVVLNRGAVRYCQGCR